MNRTSGSGKGLLLFIALGLVAVYLALRIIYPSPGNNKTNPDSASSTNQELLQEEPVMPSPAVPSTPAVNPKMLDLNRDGIINEVDFRLFVEQTKNKDMAGMTASATGAVIQVESATD